MPARKSLGSDRLSSYRAKRSAGRTPEPFGGATVPGGNRFVVQMHDATRLHWDLRLEYEGVLLSWAVPKGPSPNPADKRLAVRTEDHPLDYYDFEGLIPEGEYGGGGVIVWDAGVWIPLEDPGTGLKTGKLLFNLKGFKLQGRWTLVKTKQDEKSWLLIKERDGWARDTGTESYPEDSIFSGLTAPQRRAGFDPGPELQSQLDALGTPEGTVDAWEVKVMLAEARQKPFSRKGWIFEIKYDGYRLLGAVDGGEAKLVSRNGNDLTATFPEIERALRDLPFEGVVLDGEAVVHDEEGIPSFQRLQKRGRLQRRTDILRASVELPSTLYAFDLLAVEGRDLRSLPLLDRKRILKQILPSLGPVRYSDHIPEAGEAMYGEATRMRLEGMVAKDAASAYMGGRSAKWLKVRAIKSDDFVVVGFTEPKGGRGGFGALHLGLYEPDGTLSYAGRVGTGFNVSQLGELREVLDDLEVPSTPLESGPIPKGKAHHWVWPVLVAEVNFKEFTEEGLLRHPSLSRMRDDKPASQCVRESLEDELEEPPEVVDDSDERVVHFTNLDKPFWPEAGYTKGDLIEYYRAVAPWLLPYLADRPVVLTRYPDGIDGKSFFQKDAPDYAPDWLRTEVIWSEGSERDLHYFVCDHVESLLYLANMGTIPFHVWSSRIATLSKPDWCILDLDPKEAPFTDVVACALVIREVTKEIGLPAYVKTSGSSGLHVLVPVGRKLTYEQSRGLGELLARVVVRELPDVATVTRNPRKREGKVYVDYVQNGHGRLLVAPFSVRPKPGAPVSAPLRWSEVNRKLSIQDHTIATLPPRLKRMRKNPWAGLLTDTPDLVAALAALKKWFD